MRKLLTMSVLGAAMLIGYNASAQFGVQAGIAMPMGTFGDIAGMGFGGALSYKKEMGEGMKIGGSVGFFSLSGEEVDILGTTYEYGNSTLIPILATFDYALGDNLYVGADAGYNVISVDMGDVPGSVTGSSAALIPKAGILFDKVSVEGRFNVIGDQYLGVLVGFSF
jgi:hypothetical protein